MTPYHWIAVALLIVSVAIILHARRTRNGKWLGGVMLLVTSNVLLGVAGCSSIDKRALPPSDWPQLQVVVHKSGFMKMRECDGMIGGCTIPDFCNKRCNVYLQIDVGVIETHERAHCAGYDHPGDDTMKALWASYKRMDGPRFCSLRNGVANYCATWPEDREQCGSPTQVRASSYEPQARQEPQAATVELQRRWPVTLAR